MKRIESFCVNHDKLKPGMYVSRVDGDAITYDIRMVVPNAGTYLENDGIHTFEHLFATYVRNTADSDNILYVGPMGCRTGFYFITREGISKTRAIELERFQVPAASSAATTSTTACQRQRSMPRILPRRSPAGPRRRWFISYRSCLTGYKIEQSGGWAGKTAKTTVLFWACLQKFPFYPDKMLKTD